MSSVITSTPNTSTTMTTLEAIVHSLSIDDLRSLVLTYLQQEQQRFLSTSLDSVSPTLSGAGGLVSALSSTSAVGAGGLAPASSSSPSLHGRPFEPVSVRRLFVRELAFRTSETLLREFFEQFGRVVDAVVQRERFDPRRSKGYGFVTFASQADAQNALQQPVKELDGRTIFCYLAAERQAAQ